MNVSCEKVDDVVSHTSFQYTGCGYIMKVTSFEFHPLQKFKIGIYFKKSLYLAMHTN